MKPSDAFVLARTLMNQHGLGNWQFAFDRATKRGGTCSHSKKLITLSSEIVWLNDEPGIRNTILHEIAHALVGPGHGHGAVWQRKAVEIGCDGHRCHRHKVPDGNYKMSCTTCGKIVSYHRKPGKPRACGTCCRLHNGGKFSAQFLFISVG